MIVVAVYFLAVVYFTVSRPLSWEDMGRHSTWNFSRDVKLYGSGQSPGVGVPADLIGQWWIDTDITSMSRLDGVFVADHSMAIVFSPSPHNRKREL